MSPGSDPHVLPTAYADLTKSLAEIATDPRSYLENARVVRRREAHALVKEEVERRFRLRPRNARDVLSTALVRAAIVAGALSLVVAVAGVFGVFDLLVQR